jgi:hypothetical protein
MKEQKESGGMAVLFSLQPYRQMRVSFQRHVPAALPPGMTLYQFIGGWVDSRAVLDWCVKSCLLGVSIPGLCSL